MITIHQQLEPNEGEPVALDCPGCGGKAIASPCYETNDAVKLLYIVPLIKLRNTWIVCAECNARVRAVATLAEVSGKGGDELAAMLGGDPTPKAKRLGLWALLLSWVPFAGLILTVAAMFAYRGSDSGPAGGFNILSLIISLMATLIGVFVLIPL